MKCFDCGGTYIPIHGNLLMENDLSIGNYYIENVDWLACNKCGRKLFSSTTVDTIEAKREERFTHVLHLEPVGAFIGSTEVCKILGVTRQALSKHRRIRRGFIYAVDIGRTRLYHRKSVEQFKNTKDGRFQLCVGECKGYTMYAPWRNKVKRMEENYESEQNHHDTKG